MQLHYQPEMNSLRLTLDGEPDEVARRCAVDGYVDMGEGGRLVGIELIDGDIDLATAFGPWRQDPDASRHVTLSPDAAYVQLNAAADADTAPREAIRSSPARLLIELDDHDELIALVIPRRGSGYEITYPSGNR